MVSWSLEMTRKNLHQLQETDETLQGLREEKEERKDEAKVQRDYCTTGQNK